VQLPIAMADYIPTFSYLWTWFLFVFTFYQAWLSQWDPVKFYGKW
jgi:hypothetical protein